MKIPVTVRIMLRAILGPVFAVIMVSKFNLFNYITFVPEEYKYEVGLTAYLAIAEAILEIIEIFGEKNSATVTCVFYRRESEINIKNTPTVSCSMGTASIKCQIALSGSAKVLRDAKLSLVLPTWLSSQADMSNLIMKYDCQKITVPFNEVIPTNNQKVTSVEITIPIPLIQNMDDGILSNTLAAEIEAKWFNKIRIDYKSNSFTISNKEERDD